MPMGKGTYGSNVGRPPKKAKKPAGKNAKFADTKFGKRVMAKKPKRKPANGRSRTRRA